MQRALAHIHVFMAYAFALPALLIAIPLVYLIAQGHIIFLLLLPLYLCGLALCGAYERVIRGNISPGKISWVWMGTLLLNAVSAFAAWLFIDVLILRSVNLQGGQWLTQMGLEVLWMALAAASTISLFGLVTLCLRGIFGTAKPPIKQTHESETSA